MQEHRGGVLALVLVLVLEGGGTSKAAGDPVCVQVCMLESEG